MRRGILALLAVAALATGCTSVVDGTGSGAGGSRPTGDFPTATGTARTPAPTASGGPISVTCPTIVYPPAHLRFACIDDQLAFAGDDAVWPLNLAEPVEPSWQMAEGAGHWGPATGHSLEAIAENVRQQMLDTNAYGPNPAVKTLASKQRQVAGTAGWVLQTEFTISPAYRTQKSLKVKVERSWIVAITVGDDDVSLWYVTLPDDVKQLWSKVDDVIGTIRVT